MSDYGLSLKNASGNIQIDSQYKNYTLFNSGSANTQGDGLATFSFTATTDPPIIGIKANTSAPVSLSQIMTSGSSYVGSYMGSNAIVSVPWVVFTPTRGIMTDPYGLVVCDSAGNTVFTSSENPLKIDGVYTGSLAYPSTSIYAYVDITVKDAVNNYFYLSNWSWVLLAEPPFPYNIIVRTRGIKRISSTVIRVMNFAMVPGEALPEPLVEGSWEKTFSLIEFRI